MVSAASELMSVTNHKYSWIAHKMHNKIMSSIIIIYLGRGGARDGLERPWVSV